MGLLRPAAAATLVALIVFAAPARAGLFDDEEARKRIEATSQRLDQTKKQLEDRIAVLETQLKAQGLVDLFNQVESIKADLAKMRGQIEVLGYELEQAQKRQRDLYVDLDTRMRKLEGGPGPDAPASAAAPGAAPPAGGVPGAVAARPGNVDNPAEQRAYDASLDLFKAGSYGQAIAGFSAFVKTYPKSPLASSAQYWIGNAQFAQKDFRAAIASQRLLLANYADSPKVPDSLLNIATSQFELGDGAASRRTLEELIAKYPQSDAAAKARTRLSPR